MYVLTLQNYGDLDVAQLNTQAASNQWGSALSRFFSKPALDQLTDRKISKESLKTCRVVSQVGSKFILVVMHSASSQHLMIIDQHAADERVKLEFHLSVLSLASLQSSKVQLETPVLVDVAQNDQQLLSMYSQVFSSFGIMYSLTKQNDVNTLVVTHLPVIACTKLAIEKTNAAKALFIRKLVLDHAHAIHDKRVSKVPVDLETHWTVSIKNYPTALVDIYKSKACRDAIKFGDILSVEQCKNLVGELSDCIFPFQCAHGRPSMVPLVDLASPE